MCDCCQGGEVWKKLALTTGIYTRIVRLSVVRAGSYEGVLNWSAQVRLHGVSGHLEHLGNKASGKICHRLNHSRSSACPESLNIPHKRK